MDYDKEFKTAIAAMRPEYAHCRDYGHDWRPYDVREAGRNYERVLRCSRCETLRHQHIAKKGGRYVGGMSYTWPDDYKLKGFGAFTADDRGLVRLASIQDDIMNARN